MPNEKASNSYNETEQKQLKVTQHQREHHQRPNSICPATYKFEYFFIIQFRKLTITIHNVRKNMFKAPKGRFSKFVRINMEMQATTPLPSMPSKQLFH
jgi:hypothetical protein